MALGENLVADPRFDTMPERPASGARVTFDATPSIGGVAGISRYLWAFSNGATAFGETVTQTFAEPGEYTVRLILVHEDGTETSTSSVLSVSADGQEATGTATSEGASTETATETPTTTPVATTTATDAAPSTGAATTATSADTDTRTATSDATDTGTPTTAADGPGLGITSGLAGLLSSGYLLRRRDDVRDVS